MPITIARGISNRFLVTLLIDEHCHYFFEKLDSDGMEWVLFKVRADDPW